MDTRNLPGSHKNTVEHGGPHPQLELRVKLSVAVLPSSLSTPTPPPVSGDAGTKAGEGARRAQS